MQNAPVKTIFNDVAKVIKRWRLLLLLLVYIILALSQNQSRFVRTHFPALLYSIQLIDSKSDSDWFIALLRLSYWPVQEPVTGMLLSSDFGLHGRCYR